MPPASNMAPAAVAGINSREHCGFAIKLLSAISKFIVLIVFTWLLYAHALPRGCPYSLAPVIIFQRDRCPSLQTVQPHQKLICSQVSRKEEEEFILKSTAYLDKTQRDFILAHRGSETVLWGEGMAVHGECTGKSKFSPVLNLLPFQIPTPTPLNPSMETVRWWGQG